MPVFLTATMAIRLKDDLGIGEEALGALLSIFSVGAAVAAPIMGRLAERLGPGPSLRVASALSGVVLITIATAARGWWAIAGLLVAGGIAATLMQSSSNLWLARTIEDRRLGLAFGLKQSGGPTAALLAGVAVPVLALAVGWRWTFAAFGGFALAAVLSIPRTGLRGVGRTAPSREGDVDLGPLLVLTAGAAVSTALSAAFTGFAVTAAVQQGGLSESTSGLVFALGALTGVVTRVALGRWVDSRPDTRFGVPAVLVGAGAVGFAVLSALVALFLVAFRDADAESVGELMDDGQTPEPQADLEANYWPAVAAFGMGAMIVGLVTHATIFVIGLVIVGAAVFEWMLAAWADRATADPVVNRNLRNRIMRPIEYPVTAAIGVAVLVLALSRVFLTVSKFSAVMVAGSLATVIFFIAVVFAVAPKISRSVVAGTVALVCVGVLVAGVVTAAMGSRDFHHKGPAYEHGEPAAESGGH